MSRAKVEARKDGARNQEEVVPTKEAKPEIKQRATSNILSIFPQAQIQELKERKHTSNVLSMFPQNQIQEFKEAFTMIDANRDGFIDTSDLKNIYNSLGQDPSDEQRQKMLSECPGQLNFTAFLTLFGEKLHGTDPEATLRQAFRMFDKEGKGILEEAYIKDLLSNMGDNFTEDEIRQTWKEAPISGGLFDYNAFVTLMKRGSQDELN